MVPGLGLAESVWTPSSPQAFRCFELNLIFVGSLMTLCG